MFNLFSYASSRPLHFADAFGTWCDDLCNREHKKRRTIAIDIALKWALSPVAPGRAESLIEAIEELNTLTTLMDILTLNPASVVYGQYISEASEAIIAAIQNIHSDAMRRDGAAIWVRVSWECCEKERCLLCWKRLNWLPRDKWFKCALRGNHRLIDGFDVDDVVGIVQALRPCIAQAIGKTKCP